MSCLFECFVSENTESIRGIGSTATTILNLGTRYRRMVRLTLRLLYLQGKSLQDVLNRKFVGPKSLSGQFGEENSLLSVSGVEPLSRKLVTVRTTKSISIKFGVIHLQLILECKIYFGSNQSITKLL
jgi:hypothetical protein